MKSFALLALSAATLFAAPTFAEELEDEGSGDVTALEIIDEEEAAEEEWVQGEHPAPVKQTK